MVREGLSGDPVESTHEERDETGQNEGGKDHHSKRDEDPHTRAPHVLGQLHRTAVAQVIGKRSQGRSQRDAESGRRHECFGEALRSCALEFRGFAKERIVWRRTDVGRSQLQ